MNVSIIGYLASEGEEQFMLAIEDTLTTCRHLLKHLLSVFKRILAKNASSVDTGCLADSVVVLACSGL